MATKEDEIIGSVDDLAADASSNVTEQSMLAHIIEEIFYSPMNLCLLSVIIFLLYKIIRDRTEVPGAGTEPVGVQELPKLRRDFTIKELMPYDGTQPDGRVLVAVNGSVYDVTRGKRFYGPGGPYASFAGRDASRNLATFSVVQNSKDEYDDLSDLTPMEMESVIEWELQFKEKYEYVGKLLRENEVPTNYDDDEEEEEQQEETAKGADGLRKRNVQKESKDNAIIPKAEPDSESNEHKEAAAADLAKDAQHPKAKAAECDTKDTLKENTSAEDNDAACTQVGSTDC